MATQLTGLGQGSAQPLLSSSSTKYHRLGQKLVTDDGNEYLYVLNGAVAAVPGKLYQSPAETTGNQNLTAVAAAIGDTTIVSTSTITVTADQIAEGWIAVTVTPGQGQRYRVRTHAAYTAAAPTFTMDDPIVVALTTSSRLDVVQNPCSKIVVNPTTATSAPKGVAVYALAIAEYGWIQKSGPSNCLMDGTGVVGTSQVASNAVAGAVEPFTGVQAIVGLLLTGVADTEYGMIDLKL